MDETDDTFEALLRYLRDARGFDFTGYKRTSLMRRVRHRMEQVKCQSFEEYLDVLQADSDEFAALFNTILINVTTFFRDPTAWQFVQHNVIPAILASRPPSDPIRFWSAGCASGQEAYSMAMLLAEAIAPDEYRQRVKIYATDVDEEALTQARAATYSAKEIESVPPDLLAKYFHRHNASYVFHKDLRRAVIFGRNDLVKDAPISRVDLLACRNTLMYLNGDTQRNVLNRLHFALAPHGMLFLGHAEMLLSHSDRFTAVSLDSRIFRKTAGSPLSGASYDASAAMGRHGDLPGLDPIRESAFRAGPVAQIVVTGEDVVAMINQQAETTFGLSDRDVGRLLRDLEVSYRPLELRTYLEQVKAERRAARIQDVKWQRPGSDTQWLEIHVNPLVDADNALIGTSIVFFDVTPTRTLLDKVVDTNKQLEAAYEELQSTNEELETTNDELHTINDTLRDRSIELGDARLFLDSLVDSIQLGMVVVDKEMRVVVWNHCSEDLWGLRCEEAVGALLTSLDIGLPVDEVKPLIGKAFVDADSTGEAVVQAVNRRGRQARVRVRCNAFHSPGSAVNGALLLMEVLA